MSDLTYAEERLIRVPTVNPHDNDFYPNLYLVRLDDRGDVCVFTWDRNVQDAEERAEEYAEENGWEIDQDDLYTRKIESRLRDAIKKRDAARSNPRKMQARSPQGKHFLAEKTCSMCRGKGQIEKGGYRHHEESYFVPCPKCNAQGSLLGKKSHGKSSYAVVKKGEAAKRRHRESAWMREPNWEDFSARRKNPETRDPSKWSVAYGYPMPTKILGNYPSLAAAKRAVKDRPSADRGSWKYHGRAGKPGAYHDEYEWTGDGNYWITGPDMPTPYK